MVLMVSKILFYSIQKGDNQISDAYRHEGGNETGKLEGVVEHILADSCGPRTVKVDGGHLGGIVGDEEITIDGGEHGYQSQRIDTQCHTQRVEGADGGCL